MQRRGGWVRGCPQLLMVRRLCAEAVRRSPRAACWKGGRFLEAGSRRGCSRCPASCPDTRLGPASKARDVVVHQECGVDPMSSVVGSDRGQLRSSRHPRRRALVGPINSTVPVKLGSNALIMSAARSPTVVRGSSEPAAEMSRTPSSDTAIAQANGWPSGSRKWPDTATNADFPAGN